MRIAIYEINKEEDPIAVWEGVPPDKRETITIADLRQIPSIQKNYIVISRNWAVIVLKDSYRCSVEVIVEAA